ncbi:MAG TPA: arginine N-succinyltransferase [Thiothrix sp.]|nr:arginine N-succinyltransferase [Thiothrix sp.]
MPTTPSTSGGCLKTLGIVALTMIVTIALTYWALTAYLFPKPFEPVELNQKEETVLVKKLRQFGIKTDFVSKSATDSSPKAAEILEPEVYSEVGAKREVTFTERELNAMVAKNTDLSNKLAIDLSDNLASAKLLLPLDPDFPFFGGKTLKASAGMELAYKDERPIVILKGVSVWGVPIPNAWLGGLKNVDLIKEFGDQDGFWKSFADGVENIKVVEGNVVIKLKE